MPKKIAKFSGQRRPADAPIPAQTARVDWLVLWIFLIAAFGIKMVYFHFSRELPFFEPAQLDPKYYQAWAIHLLSHDFSTPGVFYGLPLYPYFLALLYKVFGVSFLVAKWAQALLGLVTVSSVFALARFLSGRWAGWLAAGLAACYAPLFFHEQVLTPESLAVPLYALSLLFVCQFSERPNWPKAFLAGLCLGLASLAKAGILLFVFIYAVVQSVVWIKKRQGKFVTHTLGIAGICVATLLPVTWHNWTVGKDRVFLTSHSGFNFYIGNNPQAEGVFHAPFGTGTNVESQMRDSKLVAEKEMGKELKPSEVSSYWSKKAREFIFQNPDLFAKLCVRKFVLFFDRREISDIESFDFIRQFNVWLKLPWLSFWLLGPLVWMGLLVSFSKDRRWWIIHLWLACYLVGMMLYFVNARYRLPMMGVFFVLAAHALGVVWTSFQTRDVRKWALLILGAFVGFGLGQARLVEIDRAQDYVNYGDVYQASRDFDQAEEIYRQALSIDPTHSKANLAMGTLLTRTGQYDQAKDYFLKSIQKRPDAQALNNLGLWYDREGDLENAEKYFFRASQQDPFLAASYNNLGMVYGKQGRLDMARRVLERAIQLDPQNPRTHTNLGLIYYREGKKELAIQRWEKAVEIDPTFEEAKKAIAAYRAMASQAEDAPALST